MGLKIDIFLRTAGLKRKEERGGWKCVKLFSATKIQTNQRSREQTLDKSQIKKTVWSENLKARNHTESLMEDERRTMTQTNKVEDVDWTATCGGNS